LVLSHPGTRFSSPPDTYSFNYNPKVDKSKSYIDSIAHENYIYRRTLLSVDINFEIRFSAFATNIRGNRTRAHPPTEYYVTSTYNYTQSVSGDNVIRIKFATAASHSTIFLGKILGPQRE
jgi:hypothetical protein